ncbi:coat protein [Prunus virus T]|uniref:Coat protein n=2 Tax=Prunus virus T TaxID=1472425 RepID=A0A075DMR3_9VIRU|nr:coat protein [Prunus virus T]AHM92771.1 coat protein [Prunus virus T]
MGLTKKERSEMRREVDALLITKFKPQVKQGQQFSDAAQAFLKEMIFGNIALKGASEQTEFEDQEVSSGWFVPGLGGRHGQMDPEKEFPGEENKALRDGAYRFKVNFFSLVQSLIALLRGSNNVFVNNKPFRRLCVAYASEAKAYLEAKKVDGEFSNLVLKMPATCKHAPEVCFDFNEGLDVLRLTDVQAQTMQRLSRRLFATELKKRESERSVADHIGDQV